MLRWFALVLMLLAPGCAAATHRTTPSLSGAPITGEEALALAKAPGPVELSAVDAASWQVDRAGLINLDHPKAEAAGLLDGPEPIVIRFFVLEHPTRGRFLIDSGVAAGFRSQDTAPVSWIVKSAMDFDTLRIHVDTSTWLRRAGGGLQGVFLTHLHLDHIMGLPDIPSDVPVFVGPGEAASSEFLHLFTQGTADGLLEPRDALQEWRFRRDPSGRFAGVLDVFGDGTVFALHVPGHTPGSTAFLVRTPRGPEVVTGDASHTRWGWDHQVEPGTFSVAAPRSVTSLGQLKVLERDLPGLVVHLGHQH